MLIDIILYLLHLIQYQHKQICWLLNFICRYIPLRQWAFDDSHSSRCQKFKIDQLPVIKTFYKQDWQFLLDIDYQVSDNRSVGPCILAMRMAFRHLTKLPENFRFIADGYSAYPLAAMEFAKKFKDNFQFNITQVIGLTNEDEVSKEFRPYKQMIERLNRTYKASYRPTNGFSNYDGASYDLALWVAYYNFLRPHKHNQYQVLNRVDMLNGADNMPGKWQLLIFLGQKTIQKLQAEGSDCS